MAEPVKHIKVTEIPETWEKNALYYVKTAIGVRMFVTSDEGVPSALEIDPGMLVDATTTERGLVNIGTQTFRGNKTLIGESSTVGNVLQLYNSSNTRLFNVENNGNVSIGYSGTSAYKLYVNGHIGCSYIVASNTVISSAGMYNSTTNSGKYGFGSQQPLGAIPMQIHSGDTTRSDGWISFFTAGLERFKITSDGKIGVGTNTPDYKFTLSENSNVFGIRDSSGVLEFGGFTYNSIRIKANNNPILFATQAGNVTIGGESNEAKLVVIGASSTTGNALTIKNSSGLQVATFNNNRAIEFGDSANPNYSTFFKVHGYMQATRFYIGTSTAYWSNDGVGMRVVGGYMVVEGTPANPVSILAMRKSTIGYVNDPTTPTSEMLNVYGNIKIGGTANGILMYTPDGSHQYKLSIDNNGLPVTTLIS